MRQIFSQMTLEISSKSLRPLQQQENSLLREEPIVSDGHAPKMILIF